MESFHFCHDSEEGFAEKSFNTRQGEECVPLRTVVEKFKEFLVNCGYYPPLVDTIVLLDS